LLGSLGREARERCPYREGLRFDGMEVLLFSGGDPDLPLSVPGDAVLQCLSWHWNPTLGRGWLPLGVVDMSAYQFKCPGEPDNPGACITGEYLERNTTDSAGWKRIHGAWCSVMHEADLFPQSEALSDCQPRKCTGGEICHSPGEQFHSLVPANDQWLLVTRQTWPDGSVGNTTDVDLFRVLSFSSPAVTGNGLQWSRQSGGAGRLYTGGRVVPVGAGPGAVLADGCTLLHFYEKPGAGDSGQPRLRWISFPHYKAGDADFDRRDWPLAQGCRPLLLSQEDDGVNVWVQQEAGSVQRFLLKDMEQKGARATAVESFELTSGNNGDARLQALARDQDWLYSLHVTGGEGVGAMQEFEIQRWNISNATAIPDPACHHRFNATESGRLVVTGSAVLLVPEGSLPVQQGDEYVGFKPHVPEEGGCLKWLRQPAVHQVHCPSSAINSSQTAQVCTSVADSSLPPSSFGLILPSSTMGAPMTPMTPLQSSSSMGTRITSETPVQSSRSMASSASEIPVAAASSVVALLVPMACGGALVTAACARKWHKHKGEVLPDDSMKLEDVRASSDADEDVGGINVYESVDDKAVAGAEQPREHVPPSLPPSGANPVGESQTLREERSSP
ncbi:MAG: hypothetical protein OXC07_08975, partial [Kistimonas sp.]|nr:hypothetical protein [Kistimonas sp.]